MSDAKPKHQSKGRGLPALLRESLNEKVTAMIEAGLSDIHPKYRDNARLMGTSKNPGFLGRAARKGSARP